MVYSFARNMAKLKLSNHIIRREHSQLLGRDEHVVSHAKLQSLVAVQRQVDLEIATVSATKQNLRDRTGRIDASHASGQGGCAVAMPLDLQFVRPYIHVRRRRLSIGILRQIECQTCDQSAAIFHATVKNVHIAEKVDHELA